MKIPRTVSRETLDILAPSDPRALRSRRDLQRVNRIMGTPGIIIQGIQANSAERSRDVPMRVLELGAGDGSLMLRVAQKVSAAWPTVHLTLLDRHALVDAATSAAFARVGWRVQPLIVDVLDWIAAPSPLHRPRWDVIITNLFLHHFDHAQLSSLLSVIAARCNLFVACEPRRAPVSLLGSYLLGALGASNVTRHDAVLSVRAGFRDAELSKVWPDDCGKWQLEEHAAGLFSQFFRATRRSSAPDEIA